MNEEVFVQIRFIVDTEVGKYSDAIYLTWSEYQNKTRFEIDSIKQQRVNNYVSSVKYPVPAQEPTKEQLQKDADYLQAQLDEVKARIASK